ncbi:hypothetical protein [Paludibaculum fermentans]|uniref:Uncharacterized protein n=1 Tax=Paludibaculum fermentans TaxID=1473598 RepID=A0A7S7NPK3_PALFE|nr:hypothetical protein [Paludibaculum fermentans]QOY86939.1 hypothetical protein IRI77_29820 [Paludibaculum fermentans]
MIASGIFARAPSLAQFLSYICKKHFAGESHLIKETNIALEALGRTEGFDPKKDSIVRVEAHRLRKRLKQYYEGEGATHELRIEVPLGGYAPAFVEQVAQKIEEPQPEVVVESLPLPAPQVIANSTFHFNPRWLIAAVIMLFCCGLVLFSNSAHGNEGPSPAASAQASR